ncbi:MAG: hypothetical protein J2P34_06900 [Actinobacteria bacterium]|nr:hypothetical protein [Actinomycetota bacterium]
MNAEQVAALRDLLAPTGWVERAAGFGRALRTSARTPGGLLVVGTPEEEPWHLTAHLDEESRLGGIPELAPTLVRWSPPRDAPPHLSVSLKRLEEARRGESLLVVTPQAAPGPLLERVNDARHGGAVILALDRGDPELEDLAHEALVVEPAVAPLSFDGAQHLVSFAAGARPGRERGIRGFRTWLARVLDTVSGPAPGSG